MFLDRFQPLQDELSACCARIAKSKVTIDDFANVLSAYGTDSEPIPRKLAWCAQHVFPARAWGVGSRVIRERKGHLDSPLVGQIARLDDDLVLADQPKIHSVLQRLAAWGEEIGCIPQTKIDAVLISPGVARQAYIVKGCSYDQARQISPTLQINGAIESLWGRDDRLLVNANAPREAVAALLQAREVISQCVPGYTVTPIYMIIDNVEYGWEFQC